MNLPQIDYYSCYYYNCLGNQMMAHLLNKYKLGRQWSITRSISEFS